MPRAAAGKGGVVARRPAKKNGYVMPEPLPLGDILTDLSRNQWKIGPSIGSGGFGEIYCASDAKKKSGKEYDYVVKIEPHGNGPLFVEMHFYLRNAKAEDIKHFCKKKGYSSIGMPHFIGSGSHEIKGIKHRFLVMPRYGKDIWSVYLVHKRLPQHTIYRLAIQLLDVLEYIHECTYVHADLKGANILLGSDKAGEGQAYLVDFGLASHYTTKDFKPDPKKMHNGTLEYTSRDAHNGVPTMRGDLEILGYNIIQWSGVQLPWEKDKMLLNPKKVQTAKEEFMTNTNLGLDDLFGDAVPEPIKEYMKYVSDLKFDDTPDYNKCRQIFQKGVKMLNKPLVGKLDLDVKDTQAAKVKKQAPLRNIETEPKEKKAKKAAKPSPKSTPRKRTKSPNAETPAASGGHRSKLFKSDVDSTPSKTKATVTSPAPASVKLSPGRTNTSSKTSIKKTLTPSQKNVKTYELNFELDVSMDANIIVNVHRKKRPKEDNLENSKNESGSAKRVLRVRKDGKA